MKRKLVPLIAFEWMCRLLRAELSTQEYKNDRTKGTIASILHNAKYEVIQEFLVQDIAVAQNGQGLTRCQRQKASRAEGIGSDLV
jgi:hypothetical protein